MTLVFEKRIMTKTEQLAIKKLLAEFSEMESSHGLGISKSIDDLQSYLLVMVDTAIIVQDIDNERFEASE